MSSGSKGKKLSEKERRFVEAYMGEANGNASQAARLAGYATPGTDGHRLLKKTKIQTAVQKRQEADPLVATREERQRFWTAVQRGELSPEGFDPKDRLKASELLGKASGDYLDRIANPDGSPLTLPSLVVVVKP